MNAVAASASRGLTMVAVAPAGNTSRFASPLLMPPLEWISSATAIVSMASRMSACNCALGQRRWISRMLTSATENHAAQTPRNIPGRWPPIV